MSQKYAKTHSIHVVLLLVATGLMLFGCSSSGPTRSESDRGPAPSAESRAELPQGKAPDPGEPVPEAVTRAYDLAVAAMLRADFTEAELELERFILEYPDYPGPYVNLAIVYMESGRDEEARDALERALLVDPGHAVANNRLGMVLRRQGEFEQAEAAYRQAIASDPGYALAHYNLGVLLDLYLHRPADALESYERYQSFQNEPNDLVAKWIVDLRRRLGVRNERPRVAQEDSL